MENFNEQDKWPALHSIMDTLSESTDGTTIEFMSQLNALKEKYDGDPALFDNKDYTTLLEHTNTAIEEVTSLKNSVQDHVDFAEKQVMISLFNDMLTLLKDEKTMFENLIKP